MFRKLLLLFTLMASAAQADTVVTSSGPDAASVTIYRDPARGQGAIDTRFPSGFALISEKRRLSLPAGDSTIRFESVADGMIAVSAVVTGLPGGVEQKNRDAKLLSPAALVDGSLGNRVHLRRTNLKTGEVTEQDVIIRSSSANALVLETASGFEGLQCSGLPESLTYDALPQGLSARPTLSVRTHSDSAATAEVTLTYLATGFDWNADYVVRLAPDGKTLDLSAWLTVANGGGATFSDANLLAVAGRVERETNSGVAQDGWESPALSLQCWRFDGYAAPDHPGYGGYPPPPAPPPPPMAMAARMEDITVTAQRAAQQEELGDLKLYRVPMAVDINPHAQKQVVLLDKRGIAFDSYYSALLSSEGDFPESRPLTRMLRFSNSKANGAGVPLPSGGASIFTEASHETLLLAQADLRDHAVGEEVRLAAGQSPELRITQKRLDEGKRRLTITNATPEPKPVEVQIQDAELILRSPSRPLQRKDGRWLWKTRVPSNGTVTLDYKAVEAR